MKTHVEVKKNRPDIWKWLNIHFENMRIQGNNSEASKSSRVRVETKKRCINRIGIGGEKTRRITIKLSSWLHKDYRRCSKDVSQTDYWTPPSCSIFCGPGRQLLSFYPTIERQTASKNNNCQDVLPHVNIERPIPTPYSLKSYFDFHLFGSVTQGLVDQHFRSYDLFNVTLVGENSDQHWTIFLVGIQ